MVTFKVSEVAISHEVLLSTTLEASLVRLLGRESEACGANIGDLVLAGDRQSADALHPLLRAVHLAFAQHLPLVLSPDDIWLCLAQGFAMHVEAHSEALRSRIVSHPGKLELSVIRDHFILGSPDNDWQGCFAELSDKLAAHIGKKRDLLVSSFSTTGPVERAASEVVLMAAMQAYFDYMVVTKCGIPSITLLGTVDDWRAIRRRAETLAEFDLGPWVAALLPVLDQFVAAANGDVDASFWRSLYKLHGESGGPYITGWIHALFPYLVNARDDSPIANERATSWSQRGAERGLAASSFPLGMTRAPFLWEYLGTRIPMVLWAGFAGMSQDRRTGALRPVIGWAVQPRGE